MAENIKELEVRLTELLGKKSYANSKRHCTGKWRGTIDYRLQFEDGTYVFISNGKKYYERNLFEYIAHFEYYHVHKEELETWIKSIIRNDNHTAVWHKLPLIELIGTRIDVDQFIVFDYYLCVDTDTRLIKTYKETSFSYYCKGQPLDGYVDKIKSFIYKY
ncbi:hypothetical protein [Dysgonomonas sp. ZJ709]|uniref:hypothetical protein n=1 Tax=Dysgonomonas sp. ZJ709 TaxID=2709797 RepID=UPI0013EC7147|nr:hypothetical protein [Dysgonomonas sp. ZJ709]